MEHATATDLSASTVMVHALVTVKKVGLDCHVIPKVGLCPCMWGLHFWSNHYLVGKTVFS